MPGAENKEKNSNKRDPEAAPAIILLDATITALTAGVAPADIVSALRFARAARGYKAPVWRAAADSLTDAAAAVRPQDVAQSDVELRDAAS